MKKLLIVLLASTSATIGFANPAKLFNINLSGGYQQRGLSINLEGGYNIDDNNEIGIGIGYEGFKQSIYEVKSSVEDQLLDAIKELLHNSVLGRYTIVKAGTLQGLGQSIMGKIANNDREVFARVVKNVYDLVLSKTHDRTAATTLATGLQQLVYGPDTTKYVLDNLNNPGIYDRTKIKPISNEELKKYIEQHPNLSAEISKLAPTVRQPLHKLLAKKIDKLNFKDLIIAFRKLSENTTKADHLKDPTNPDIPTFTPEELKTSFANANIWTIKNDNLKPYKYTFNKYFNHDINDPIKREEIFKGVHGLLTIIAQKIDPTITIKPFDNNILGRIDEANIKDRNGSDPVVVVKPGENPYRNVFYLNEIAFGGVNSTLKEIAGLKENKAEILKTIRIDNIFSVNSHNLTQYFYAKQRFLSGQFARPYFKEEIGVMEHITNPYAKLSVFGTLGFGVEFANQFAIGVKGQLYVPVISDYNKDTVGLEKGVFRVPQFLDFGVNATFIL